MNESLYTRADMIEMRDNIARKVSREGQAGMLAFLVLGFLVGAIMF